MAGLEIGFEHDVENDLFVIYPCGHIATEDDCRVMLDRYDRRMGPLSRKWDAIFVLDMLSIDPAIGPVFADYRRIIHDRYLLQTIRVTSEAQAKLVFDPAAKKMPLATQQGCAADIPTAVAIILEVRRIGRLPPA